MRQKRLEEWEAEVLDRMENGGPKPYIEAIKGVKATWTIYPNHSSDVAGKRITCPFADGSDSFVFKDFFLKRRKAVPLYKVWSRYTNFEDGGGFAAGPMAFRHTDGQTWLYDWRMSELTVIEEGSINIPK